MLKISDSEYQKSVMKISEISIVVNVFLSLMKFFCGVIGHSSAMVSDSIHSLSDVFSTFIVMIGVKMSAKKSDSDHRYGHERLECVAAILLSAMLAVVGLGLGVSGIKSIISYNEIVIPSLMAAIAAIISILVKEIMFRFTRNTAKRINSNALMADAWHHRSDALSSIGSFIGVAGAMLGFPILDPLASIVICGFILLSAYEIFKDATDKMVDKACDKETEDKIAETAKKIDGVISLDLLRTRLFGSKIYVDMEISADKNLTLENAHKIAQNVHDKIEEDFPLVKHCMIHVNPK